MKDALPSEAVVQAGFPSAALELLVVESRGWKGRSITVEDAKARLLADASGVLSSDDITTAVAILAALGDARGVILPMRVWACCAVNAEVGCQWHQSRHELPAEAWEAVWHEEEVKRAALLFRVLEARRGVPTDRAAVLAALDGIGVPEPYRSALPASLAGDEHMRQEQTDSESLAIRDFAEHPLVVTLARAGLASTSAAPAVANQGSSQGSAWHPRPFIAAVRAVVLTARGAVPSLSTEAPSRH